MPTPVEELRVLYGGALQIPLCTGSIAVPLTLEKTLGTKFSVSAERCSSSAPSEKTRRTRRKKKDEDTTQYVATTAGKYTHRRYCYLRDGGDIRQDSFYRWLFHERRNVSLGSTSVPHHKRSRHEERDAAGGASLKDEDMPASSPSLLYAMVDHVTFVLPPSFPSPQRTVYDPPFVIEDVTWAEHMVEVHIHFKPHLLMSPLVLLHHVHLHPHVEDPPSLLSSTLGKSKPASMVIIREQSKELNSALSIVGHRDGDGLDAEPPSTRRLASLLSEVVVAERKDAARVFHPSVDVVRFAECVFQKASSEVLSALEDHYWDQMYTTSIAPENLASSIGKGNYSDTSSSDDNLPSQFVNAVTAPNPWDLPLELCIYAYEKRRGPRAVATMTQVLNALEGEQNDLLHNIKEMMQEVVACSRRIQDGLDKTYTDCLQHLKVKQEAIQ